MKSKFVVKSLKLMSLAHLYRSGQTLVEYALILAFISVVAIAVLKLLGSKVSSVFSTVNAQLSAANSGS